MNSIQPSKSSRASCRSCKKKIDKGVARLGVETQFQMGGDTVTSIKWHHLSCGMENMPDAVLTAEVVEEVTSRGKPLRLSESDLKTIEEFKEKHQISGIAIKGISEIDTLDTTVNIEAVVLRKMSASTELSPDGEEERRATVYVEDDGHRSKIILWGDHSNQAMSKGDRIVSLGARSFLASNDNIQFHVSAEADLLVNPTEEELDEISEDVTLYVSEAWERPPGKPAEFTYAPSGRAACGVCGKKISKGELKLVKPSYIELDNGMTVSGNISFHVGCILDDEHGIEVIHEAATRLTLDFIAENIDLLSELHADLPSSEAKSVLGVLL